MEDKDNDRRSEEGVQAEPRRVGDDGGSVPGATPRRDLWCLPCENPIGEGTAGSGDDAAVEQGEAANRTRGFVVTSELFGWEAYVLMVNGRVLLADNPLAYIKGKGYYEFMSQAHRNYWVVQEVFSEQQVQT